MPFVNEKTYQRYVQEGREEEFHKLFEEGLKKLSEELGREYPILLGDRELKTREKIGG